MRHLYKSYLVTLVILVVSSFLWSCENDIIFTPVVGVNAACSNGIKDDSEADIDCGPTSCKPCRLTFEPATCTNSLTDNKLTIDGQQYLITTSQTIWYSDYTVVKADYGSFSSSSQLVLELPITDFSTSHVLSLANMRSYTEPAGYPVAGARLYQPNYSSYSPLATNKDVVYLISEQNGLKHLEFCNVDFISGNSSVTLSGRITLE